MQDFAVKTPCVACGFIETIYVVPMDYIRWSIQGVHAQDAFPYLTDEERDCLISGMCLDCLDEMYNDLVEEEEDDYEEWLEAVYGESPMDPESDFPEYESDYYVDRDCD